MPDRRVLLTLSNGKQCRSLIPILLSDPSYTLVRAFARNSASAKGQCPNHPFISKLQVFEGDLRNVSDIEKAMEGIDTVFHVGPPMSVHESSIGISVIQAARKAGVKHFVLSSVLQPFRSKLLNHDVKLAVEEYLVESRLNWTILQPTHFMQSSDLLGSVERGCLFVPWDPANVISFVDARDMADVVKKVMDDGESHYNATYELVGQTASYRDYGAAISRIAGKEIKVERADPRAVSRVMGGEEEDLQDRFERLFLYYDRWGLIGNSNVLGWLLGKPPRTLDVYVKDRLAS